MEPTKSEIEAVEQLAHSLLKFLAALEDGWRLRQQALAPKEPPEASQPSRQPESAGDSDLLLVSARKAAEILSVSERFLWAMTSPRGPLPAVRIGHAVRYSVEQLRRWIKENRD